MSNIIKVVPLHPHSKPCVARLAEGIEGVIEHFLEDNDVTRAEVVGMLEIIKHEYI